MNTNQNFWRIASTVGVLLTVFLAVLSIKEIKSIGYVGKSDQVINTISVNGTGDAFAVPDIATFSFTVTQTAKLVPTAQTQATNQINTVLKSIRDAGVADKDIQTLSYSINPHYEYQQSVCTVNSCPPTRSILTGYEVSQTIQVKVRDLSKAGSLFSLIGSQDVKNINGLNFSVDNIEAIKTQARQKAIDDAKSKANALSKQLGVGLVRITSFYDNNDQPMYGYGAGGFKAMAADSAAPSVPTPEVPKGEQKVTSNVTITYEIL